ncbi:hypothetical protein HELRODRAFT_83777, partial [Helobdella robusta]|uniref:Uncharacterized protein n=1 Tax=Helobdella robusta TaxID=6412 RepID=T1G5A1_HELRO
NEPIKFSSSKAHSYSSFDTFLVKQKRSSPWYQPLIITFSVAIFLIYFGFLREENDWDEDLKLSLYDRIPGLKEKDEIARKNFYKK